MNNNLLQDRFDALVLQWHTNTGPTSNMSKILKDPAYLEIIAMGEAALPLIFKAFEKELDHWSHALTFITGEDPVSRDAAGDLVKIREVWLKWWQETETS